MAESKLLDVLAERVLVFDGAMGTQLQAAELSESDFSLGDGAAFSETVRQAADRIRGKSLDGCNELLNLTRPDVVERIHASYLAAGADIIETNTFGCTSVVLAEYDIQDLVYEIALAAGQIARRAADAASTSGRPRFVTGALGPGTKLISLGQISWKELVGTYALAFCGLLESGCDALLLETQQDLLMVKGGIIAAVRAMAEIGRRVPLLVQVTMEQTGAMLLGTELGAALNSVEAFSAVTAFGINCATGPLEMASHVRYLGQNSTRPIAVQPNAGLPVMERGHAVYHLTPEELAGHHERFVSEHGAALVGGCCGTTPAHIEAVAQAVGGQSHTADCHWIRKRSLFPGFDFQISTPKQADALSLIGCSSLYQFQPYRQDASVLMVGEKTNANGSRAFRDRLAAEDWDALTELARETEGEGSHVLDVCVAYVGRNDAIDMQRLLSHYNRHITSPLMIDSTEVPVMEIALQTVAGKPLLNSINFEDGEGRARKVLELARTYGAGVVGLTIDEAGMAKSADEKVRIAERLLTLTREYGLPDHDVFIDCLTFTLGSGDEEFRAAGLATIEAIRRLAQSNPRVNTILGVSNISFGLKASARPVLNSAFLHYAREVGLTAAIVHVAKIQPETRVDPEIWNIASDLVFDRRRFSAA